MGDFSELEREVDGVFEALAGLMDGQQACDWIDTPNATFGNRSPFQTITDGECDKVMEAIKLMASGEPRS